MDTVSGGTGSPKGLRRWRSDLAILALVVVLAGTMTHLAAARIPAAMGTTTMGNNVWFEGDSLRVFTNMTENHGREGRTNVHPLFSLLAYATVGLMRLCGIPALTAVHLALVGIACAWTALLYTVQRLIGIRRPDALIYSVVALTSSAALFWFSVPETYAFGSTSILLGLCVAAAAGRRKLPDHWLIAAGVVTLSITVTNWMVGVITAFLHRPPARAARLTLISFALVSALMLFQGALIKGTSYMLGRHVVKSESRFIAREIAGGPLVVTRSLMLHGMVMPEITARRHDFRHDYKFLTVQWSDLGSTGPAGVAATCVWVLLLAVGLWGLFRSEGRAQFRWVLGLVLLGQWALHLVYGTETFLYVLHVLPLLVLVCAFGSLTRARPLSLVLAVLLIALAGWNNSAQFQVAARYLDTFPAKAPETLDKNRRAAAHSPNANEPGNTFPGSGPLSIRGALPRLPRHAG